MSFSVTSESKNGIAQFTLVGELDAAAAGEFKAAIEQAAASQPKRVVLIMNELTYMASAGLRTLVFAKQKMGAKRGHLRDRRAGGCARDHRNDRLPSQRDHARHVRRSRDRERLMIGPVCRAPRFS